jgi:DNA-binding phage protein
VIDDDGFLRHIDAQQVDREVLAFFVEQLRENQDLAVAQMLQMIGSDDLMTKAAIESQMRNVTVDQILAQGLPPQARDMLGMVGFRVVINVHGELVRLDQPTLPGGEED